MKTLEERRLEFENMFVSPIYGTEDRSNGWDDEEYGFDVGVTPRKLWQWFKLQLEERDNERLKEVSGKVNNIWEIAYKEKASKDHKDRYLNGVVRGITLVGRYLSTLKNSKENK